MAVSTAGGITAPLGLLGDTVTMARVRAVIADAYGIPWRPLRSAAADDGEHGVRPRPAQLREGAHGEVLSFTTRDQADGRDDRDFGRDAERGAQGVRLAGGRRTELGGVDEVRQGDDFGHPVPRQQSMAARDIG